MADVETVTANIKKMSQMGASMAEVDTYVASTGFSVDDIRNAGVQNEPQREYTDMPTGFVSSVAPEEPMVQRETLAKTASSVYTPALEAGGAVAGVMAGTPGGVVGSALAGAGGFTMGANAADRLDEFLGVTEKATLKENLKQTGDHFGTGLMFEMGVSSLLAGGALAGKSVLHLAEKYGVTQFLVAMKNKFPKLSDKAILRKASDLLKDIRKELPGIEGTQEYTEELLKRAGITTKPTHAQMTGNPSSARLESNLAEKDPQLKTFIKGKTALINKEANENIAKQFPEDIGVSEVKAGVQKHNDFLQKEAELATKLAETARSPMSYGDRVNTTGKLIKDALIDEKVVSNEVVSEAYKLVPGELTLPPTILKKTIKDLIADFRSKGGGKDTFPKDMIRQMREAIYKKKPKSPGVFIMPPKNNKFEITVDNLMDWRSQLTQDIKSAESGATPNYKLSRRLRQLKNSIDDTFGELGNLGPEYKEAAEIYNKAVDKRSAHGALFQEGSVGKVLQYGKETDGAKIVYSDIPAKFFTTGKVENAQALINVVGKDKAKGLIDDFVSLDLLAKADDGGIINISRGNKWLKQNKDVLDEFGLYKKYDDMIKSRKVANDTVEKFNDYSTAVVKKILMDDPDKVIGRIFSGAGKAASVNTMRDLLNLPGIKGNAVAVKGLQNGFKDFLLKKMRGEGVDILGNPLPTMAKSSEIIKEFSGAMKILYKDSPGQAQALIDYNKLLVMLGKNHETLLAAGTIAKGDHTIGSLMADIGGDVVNLGAVKMGKGWFYSVSRNLIKSLITGPGKFSRARVDEIMKNAIYHPEQAKILMGLTKPVTKKAAEAGRMQLRSLMLRGGTYMGAGEYLSDKVSDASDQLYGRTNRSF